jgi:hypothetical protein
MVYLHTLNPNTLGILYFGGPWNVECWCILCPFGIGILWSFGIFCGHLVYFVVIWYMFHILVCATKKNLATLL